MDFCNLSYIVEKINCMFNYVVNMFSSKCLYINELKDDIKKEDDLEFDYNKMEILENYV